MIQELRKLEKEGLITLRPHNKLPLLIANYTPEVQYDRSWNDHPLLTQCRGLIVDTSGKVIARPFPKFFNYEEHMDVESLPDIPNEPFEVYNKLDGSLGILFNYEGEWILATRGSFHSDQAEYATKNILPKYKYKYLPSDTTYLLEIIYPTNQIVVNYGDDEMLVMLASIHTESGEEYDIYSENYIDLGFPITTKYKFSSFDEIINSKDKFDDGNTEGFVIKFESGLRIKVKLDEYVKLHRLLTGLTKRTIWELLRDGEDIEKIYSVAPDEVYEWVEETVRDIQKEYKDVEFAAKVIFMGLLTQILDTKNESEKRKKFALSMTDEAKKSGFAGILFAWYDESEEKANEIIWKLIKPDHETINS